MSKKIDPLYTLIGVIITIALLNIGSKIYSRVANTTPSNVKRIGLHKIDKICFDVMGVTSCEDLPPKVYIIELHKEGSEGKQTLLVR